ncbi:oligosaccharide flippase family protein, partial [Bacillus sp. JJ1566]|uniref:oligosaccharide flippase family protein n=1 Tax=Bacillus sp. JJ1566 TaxID=3122961 RepID=UPI002FFE5BDC
MRFLYYKIKKIKQDSLIETFVRIASGTFLIKLVGAALVFIMQVYIARVLDLENYGYYSYTMALIGFSSLFMLGFEMATVRYVAAYSSHNNISAIKGIYKKFRKIVFFTSLIITIIGLSIVIFSSELIKIELFVSLIIASILLPIYTGIPLLSGVLRGLQNVILPETM